MARPKYTQDYDAIRGGILAVLKDNPDGLTAREIAIAYNKTRGDFPPINGTVARKYMTDMTSFVRCDRSFGTLGVEFAAAKWFAR